MKSLHYWTDAIAFDDWEAKDELLAFHQDRTIPEAIRQHAQKATCTGVSREKLRRIEPSLLSKVQKAAQTRLAKLPEAKLRPRVQSFLARWALPMLAPGPRRSQPGKTRIVWTRSQVEAERSSATANLRGVLGPDKKPKPQSGLHQRTVRYLIDLLIAKAPKPKARDLCVWWDENKIEGEPGWYPPGSKERLLSKIYGKHRDIRNRINSFVTKCRRETEKIHFEESQ